MIEINKFYIENCLNTMARMPDGFIDLTVTSPPYDNLRDYNGYEFDFESIAKELYRVTKQGGVVVWVVNDETKNGSESGKSFEQALFFKNIGFNLHDTMIYEKEAQFPETTRYYPCTEFMFILAKGKPKSINLLKDRKNNYVGTTIYKTQREKDGTLKKGSRHGKQSTNIYSIRKNIWKYNTGFNLSTTDKIAFNHPAIFPEKLAADHIYSWSNEGDLVYDPFVGSGTTVKMAIKLKRKWIASDLSEDYIKNIAEKRIKPLLMQQTLF